MTKIPPKPKNWLKYPWNLKITKIPLKPKKWLNTHMKPKKCSKYPWNPKMTKIPPILKKWPKCHQNLKFDWNTPETKNYQNTALNLKNDKKTSKT